MTNEHIFRRLEGVRQGLMSTHISTVGSASATKGAARAEVVSQYLSKSLPTAYRIGSSAEVTDQQNNITGELDIVLENGFAPSFPIAGPESGRLYLAEGVGAVIEVKSNLQNQWAQAVETAKRVKALRRSFSGGQFGRHGSTTIFQVPMELSGDIGSSMPEFSNPVHDALTTQIPMFVIGYEGWATEATARQKLDEAGVIDGILQLDTGLFVSNDVHRGISARNGVGLYALLTCVMESFSYISSASFDALKYFE